MSCLSTLLPWSHRSSPVPSTDDCFDEERKPPAYIENVAVDKSTDKLESLRAEMREAKIDAYIVPTADAHASEFVCETDKRRAWLSGFTGSAGTAIVTTDEAHMFTDSRYWIQAGQQLGPGWKLEKINRPDVLAASDYIASVCFLPS